MPGLDYLAEDGNDPDVSAGVIQAHGPSGELNTMEESVCRRLFPQNRPVNPQADWPKPTCFAHELFLPAGAHDDFWREPQKLCRAYDLAAFPGLRDILISATLRAPWLEEKGLRIHEFHQVVDQFERIVFSWPDADGQRREDLIRIAKALMILLPRSDGPSAWFHAANSSEICRGKSAIEVVQTDRDGLRLIRGYLEAEIHR